MKRFFKGIWWTLCGIVKVYRVLIVFELTVFALIISLCYELSHQHRNRIIHESR